jgi:hypothetical protein
LERHYEGICKATATFIGLGFIYWIPQEIKLKGTEYLVKAFLKHFKVLLLYSSLLLGVGYLSLGVVEIDCRW